MAQNLLKELLEEEQEPFHLKDYITNKQQQLKNQNQSQNKTQLQKTKPITKNNSSFFCKNACFFTLLNSPDVTMSPFIELDKSPRKSPNRVFLNVPSKTASLLLEAAIRIQKETKPGKKRVKNSGFGLFGSVLKRLTNRKRWSNEMEVVKLTSVGSACTSCSTSSSSSSSSYSCSNTCSSSGRSVIDDADVDDDDEFVFCNVLKDENGGGGGGGGGGVCLSPFGFALRSSPLPELRSPVLSSPVKSPVRYNIQDDVKYKHEEEDEDKEQNSPVSVFDPPFEDDYDGHEEEPYDLQCSYAFVQRAKHHLLDKLQRFEKLAEWNPIELEKRSIENEVDYEEYEYESFNFDEDTQVDEIIAKLGFQDIRKPGIKRLISDLIIHEEIELDDEEQVIKRVCKRLESWKEVEANTIDMMVGMDLRREIGNWKNYKEQIDETTKDLEVAIFAILVDEVVNDLSSY